MATWSTDLETERQAYSSGLDHGEIGYEEFRWMELPQGQGHVQLLLLLVPVVLNLRVLTPENYLLLK
jgi:hypothetical protein